MKLITLLGTISGTPSLKKAASGVSHTHFTIAVDVLDRTGEDATELYDAVAFGTNAARIARLTTGDPVLVHGTFHRVTYIGQGGVKHLDIEIKVSQITVPTAARRRRAP